MCYFDTIQLFSWNSCKELTHFRVSWFQSVRYESLKLKKHNYVCVLPFKINICLYGKKFQKKGKSQNLETPRKPWAFPFQTLEFFDSVEGKSVKRGKQRFNNWNQIWLIYYKVTKNRVFQENSKLNNLVVRVPSNISK